ncbi:MAG TPA: M14 family metallocarboxypeptidase [Anoxybacillus sp.]|nr:M14 family metallocarboxypeptidase [Anoxybacillus sp.]
MKVLKAYLTMVVCLIAVFLFTSMEAKAAEPFIETVADTEIYQKQGDEFVKIGILRAGEPFKVLSSLEEQYYTVQVGEETVYILKTSVKELETLDPSLFTEKGNTAYFQMYTLKETPLYSIRGTERKEIATVSKNVTFSMLEDAGNFYKVLVAGRVAYLDKSAVQFIFPENIQAFEVTADEVPVYENRAGKFIKIGSLKKGQVFQRKHDYGDNWHEIEFGQLSGYVPKAGTKPTNVRFTPVSPQPFTYLVKVGKTTPVYNRTTGTRAAVAHIQPGQVFAAKKLVGNAMYEIVVAGKVVYLPKNTVSEMINSNGVVNPKQTYTYEQMQKDIKRLETFYPQLVQSQIIGHSVEGRNIYAVKLGKGQKEIFMNASHHAREHITTNLLMEMLDLYAFAYSNRMKIENYDVEKILNQTTIWFVPMVNPDGVTLVQKGHKAVKNSKLVLKINKGSTDFSAWKANIRGVDLNRQYDANWKNICCDPGKPAPQNYKGPRPFSEPETQAMRDFTLAHNFQIAVSYHSSGEIIYWHFHQSGERQKRDHRLALMLAKKTGYSLVKPRKNPSGGGYTDWFISRFKKPAFTPEVSKYVGKRPVPIKNFPSIWEKNKVIGLMMASEAK